MMNSKGDLELLSKALDSKFKIGNFRFGYDGLIGLIPVAGNAVTMSLSIYIVFRALLMKYPSTIIIKMTSNILIENIIGVIPIIGNIFDFFWKSNLKNMRLMQQYDTHPEKTVRSTKLKLLILVIFLIGLFILSLFIVIWITAAIFQWLF